MPLLAVPMQNYMRLKGLSYKLTGDKFPAICAAISSATCKYILSASIVNSTNIALGPGSGTQTGTLQGLNANAMAGLMLLKATSYGFSGKDIRKLFNSVSFGVVMAMKTVLLQGTIIGAGPGTGNGKVVGLTPVALGNLIYVQCVSKKLTGKDMRKLMSAVAFGICNHIMSAGTVIATDIGIAASPPAGPVTIPMAPGVGRLV